MLFLPLACVAKFGVKIDGANPSEGSATFTDNYKYVGAAPPTLTRRIHM